MKHIWYIAVGLLVILSGLFGYSLRLISAPPMKEEVRKRVSFARESNEYDVVVTRATRRGKTWYYFEFCQAACDVPVSGQAYIISTDSLALTDFSVDFREDVAAVSFNASGLWPHGSESRLVGRVRNGVQRWAGNFPGSNEK